MSQKELDDATKELRDVIRRLDALTNSAARRADRECKAGNNEASASLRGIEASLRMASGMATEAYAKGRMLKLPDDGGIITPFIGGKG